MHAHSNMSMREAVVSGTKERRLSSYARCWRPRAWSACMCTHSADGPRSRVDPATCTPLLMRTRQSLPREGVVPHRTSRSVPPTPVA
jgi:hypothetical protein